MSDQDASNSRLQLTLRDISLAVVCAGVLMVALQRMLSVYFGNEVPMQAYILFLLPFVGGVGGLLFGKLPGGIAGAIGGAMVMAVVIAVCRSM